MSFSQDVREELIKHYDKSVHCQKAELAAIMMFQSRGLALDAASGRYIYSDPRSTDRNGFTVSRKTFNINGVLDLNKDIGSFISKTDDKRAFLRGAFIASGTISDPEKEYHFEITAPDEGCADMIVNLLASFGITARVFRRRDINYVVYVKDREEISLILNIMNAHVAMMDYENVKIEKELNSAVNRRLNCDTANINKAVSASMKQIDDIELIRDTIGFDRLDDGLRNICEVRLANPDATIAEIGELLVPKVGKSGANHRFRKISQMAENMRKQTANK